MKAIINNRFLSTIDPAAKPFEVWDANLTGFILRVQPSGRMTYICQYARGRRMNISPVGVLTPIEARAQAKEILSDVLKGYDPQEAKRKAQAHNLENYILNVYAPWAQTHHSHGHATIAMIKANFFPTIGKHKLDEITAWSVEKWRSERLKAGSKPASINRYLNALKAALSRAVDWGLIKENPLGRIKLLKTDSKTVVRFLTDDEEDRLRTVLGAREDRIRQERTSANTWRAERGYKLLPDLAGGFADHLKPMVLLSLNTGLRRGELFNLKWSDVDIERAKLTVRGESAKSGQTRHIPLNDEALAVLTTWPAQSHKNGLVFSGHDGSRFDNVNSSWRNLLKDAKIVNFRWQDMRHHFASRLIMIGIDLNTVQELLGHADIKMTLRYAHLAPAVKSASVQKLVRIDNPHFN